LLCACSLSVLLMHAKSFCTCSETRAPTGKSEVARPYIPNASHCCYALVPLVSCLCTLSRSVPAVRPGLPLGSPRSHGRTYLMHRTNVRNTLKPILLMYRTNVRRCCVLVYSVSRWCILNLSRHGHLRISLVSRPTKFGCLSSVVRDDPPGLPRCSRTGTHRDIDPIGPSLYVGYSVETCLWNSCLYSRRTLVKVRNRTWARSSLRLPLF
jgi:hypothetical protein